MMVVSMSLTWILGGILLVLLLIFLIAMILRR